MHQCSIFYKINLFIRSLVFSIITTTTAIIWSVVCLASFPFPLKYRFGLVILWTNWIIRMMKHVCHVDYNLVGAENIPADRNGVILCKHQSTWETFFMPGLFHGPAIILKRELYWLPFFGWALAVSSPIAINRSDRSSAMDQVLKKGKKCLDEGRWVLVFPEGTRVAPGQVGKYRLGGARLAVNTGYPVIPVAHNAGRFWARRKFIKTPGTIQVVVGSLIETQGKTPEEVLQEAKTWIEDTIVKIDSKI